MDLNQGSYNKHGIIPFKGTDYPDWSFRVKLLLESHSVWSVVSTAPANPPAAGWAANDVSARRYIVECIDNSCLEYVKGKNSAYEMWQALKAVFDTSSHTKRVLAYRKLNQIEFNSHEGMQSFFHAFDVSAREYTSCGGTLAETELITIMISRLPDEFNGVVTAISALSETNFTKDKIRGILLEEECRIKGRTPSTSSSSELTAAFFNKFQIRCYNCNEMGHKADKCGKLRKKDENTCNNNQQNFQRKKKWNKNKGKNRKGPGGYSHALMVNNSEFIPSLSRKVRFICDSACSDHLTNDLSILKEVRNIQPLNIDIAKEGESLKVSHVGSLSVQSIVNGREVEKLTIGDVKYSPNVCENLLSLGALDEKGVKFEINNGRMIAKHNGVTIFIAEKIGRLYYVTFEMLPLSAFVADKSKVESTLWHKRLGHISIQSICKMAKSGMVSGISQNLTNDIDFCDCCVKAKMTRDKFSGTRPATKRPLERVHSDVCGPFTPSHDGSQYYVTFIDDFTHLTNTYLMKNKSEVLIKFKNYCEMAQSHFGLKISRMRCDNGGEYTSTAFKKFCSDNGIIIEYTVPYNPQMNGVSERMNRTICDKMRALLYESKLPEEFWGDAVLTATYLTNRSATVSLKSETPYEMWFGEKPNLSNLKVFGCKAFCHVPKEKRRGKLAFHGEQFIFVGYGFNAYRLYDVRKKSVVMGRSVIFDEDTSGMTTLEDSSPSLEEQVVNVSPITNLNQTVIPPPTPRVIAPNTPIPQSTPIPRHTQIPQITPDTSIYMTPNKLNTSQTPSTIVQSPAELNLSLGNLSLEDSNNENSIPITSTPVVRRYPRRQRTKPFWQRTGEFDLSANYVCFKGNRTIEIPQHFDDVTLCDDETEWRSAINDEVQSLLKNETWEVVNYRKGMKLLDSRWIFKKKYNQEKCVYKARLVAKGYMQKEGVDYVETYAPVARLQTIRILLAIGNKFDLEIEHLDVKTAFLNGDLEEEVYMRPPKGIEIEDGKVLKLRKSLYGLKQSPRCWNAKFHDVMTKLNFKRSDAEPCLYIKSSENTVSIIVLYVDDMLFLCNDKNEMNFVKERMTLEFEIKDLGSVENFMGIEINRDRKHRILTLSQEKYAKDILTRFDMIDSKPRAIPIEVNLDLNDEDTVLTEHPYRELLGSLMYLMLGTRPDIAFAVNKMSRYQDKATDTHWSYLKSILRYVNGTSDYKLIYRDDNDVPLSGFVDSDWANDKGDRKSTTGFLLHVYGNLVVWCSKKQQLVTLSSTEAEYVAACQAVQESIWVEKLLTNLDIELNYPIEIYEDNFGCVMISKNPETKRTKHIDVKFHFLRNLVWEGRYVLTQVSTKDQLADIMTKGLTRVNFERFVSMMGLQRGEVLREMLHSK